VRGALIAAAPDGQPIEPLQDSVAGHREGPGMVVWKSTTFRASHPAVTRGARPGMVLTSRTASPGM
jgi:hypothetical protein